MFTGIVSETGRIVATESIEGGKILSISSSFAGECHIDESIAVNGVCLTVVDFDDNQFSVQCVEETLRKTNMSSLDVNDSVNLERSLTLDKAIEGHIVQGHVDTTGRLTSIKSTGADVLLTIEFPEEFEDYVVGRGSICIDGISLTVAQINKNKCTVAIIPYTLEHTSLKSRKEGDLLNIEFDIFGKYIVRYLEKRSGNLKKN